MAAVMHKPVSQIFREAREFIARGWTTGNMARDSLGLPVSSRDPRAVAWCALGALSAANHGLHWDLVVQLHDHLPQEARDDIDRCVAISRYNDKCATQEDILDLFERAILATTRVVPT